MRVTRSLPQSAWLIPSLATAAFLWAHTSAAQPNPFDDYEKGAPAPPATAPAVPAPALPAPGEAPKSPDANASGGASTGGSLAKPGPADGAAPGDGDEQTGVASGYASAANTWGLGGALQLAYNGGSNEIVEGQSQASYGLFVGAAPRGSYFPIESLEVSLAAGYLSTAAGASSSLKSVSHNFFAEAGAHYHVRIAQSSFAFVPGAGIGGYVGSSTRSSLDAAGEEINISASSMGLLVSGYLTAAYQITPQIRVRSGLVVSGTFGSEKPESAPASLSTSRAFVGLPLEVTYSF